MNVGGMFDIY